MSLGLPSHLARKANGRALASAFRVAALVALAAAAASVLIPGVAELSRQLAAENALFTADGRIPWLGMLAVVALAAMFVALTLHRTVALGIATLVVGAGGTFIFALTVFEQNPSFGDSGAYVLALPVITMTLIGGTGSGTLVGMIWASAGFALGEIAMFAATALAGREFVIGTPTLRFYLLIVAILAIDGLTRNTKRSAQAHILRAMRDAQAAVIAHEVATAVTADVHDTTLSDLTALAQAAPGPLAPATRRSIESSIAAWGRDRAEVLASDAHHAQNIAEAWRRSALEFAVDQARDEGLELVVSGDRAVLIDLPTDRAHALGLAVRQALANVLRHSGQNAAELTLSASEGAVSATVVDTGAGFDTRSTREGAIGIQHSIRDRIEGVGGRVAVFSRPGTGTSISMTVPYGNSL